MSELDTIAAQATPPGQGGVGIIRVSGKSASLVAEKILGKIPKARTAEYLPFRDQEGITLDIGLALYFPAPNSFTGEDVLELHAHGGPIILDCLLENILNLGARMAHAGEFSQRAFLNNKIDLAQAEAIADLISAGSRQAARSAMRSLEGDFSKQIDSLKESITHLRMYVESAIDFPEEEIDFLAEGDVEKKLQAIMAHFKAIQTKATQGAILREGMTVVIAGKPNAGKSTLLNGLSGREAAIVTDVPGTTRDVMREHIQLDGIPVTIIDTAGLRESDDVVEQEGIRRAWLEIEKADCILLVIDSFENDAQAIKNQYDTLKQQMPAHIPCVVIANKSDLSTSQSILPQSPGLTSMALSAKSGEGLEQLTTHLKELIGVQTNVEGRFLARRRHLAALEKTEAALQRGQRQIAHHRAGELLAQDLREAQESLSEITGEFTSDDLLGEIFSSFCIGK